MSNRGCVEIHIGGPAPDSIMDRLIRAIVETEASLDNYGEAIVCDESVREVLGDGGTIDLYDDEARYDRFEDLQQFLVEHKIHFNLHQEDTGDFDAEIVYYRGGFREVTLPATRTWNLVIDHGDVVKILNDEGLDEHRKVKELRKLTLPSNISPLEPIRFVSSEGATDMRASKEEKSVPKKNKPNIARIIYHAYPNSDLLPIDPERDCLSLETLLKKVMTQNIGDTLFKFIVIEIVEGGEGSIKGAIRVLERAGTDVDAVLQALHDAEDLDTQEPARSTDSAKPAK